MDRTVAEVKCRMDAEQNVKAGAALTFKVVRECLDILKGAVSIVYPMGLPEYDPVRMELENREGIPNPSHHSFPNQPIFLRMINHMAYAKEYLHGRMILSNSQGGTGGYTGEQRGDRPDGRHLVVRQP